jgi:hypothetical protein
MTYEQLQAKLVCASTDPRVFTALARILHGESALEALAETVVELAEDLRRAEDHLLVERLKLHLHQLNGSG